MATVRSAHESAESEGQERPDRHVGAQSMLYFAFPFTFRGAAFDELAANVDRAQTRLWQPGLADEPVWRSADLRSVRQYMLPHLSEYLNRPSAELPDRGDGIPVGAAESRRPLSGRLWELTPAGLAHVRAGSPLRSARSAGEVSAPGSSLPSAAGDGIAASAASPGRATWTLALPRRRQVEIDIVGGLLAFFCSGVGSLTLRVVPLSEELDDWIDCSYHLSKLRGARLVVSGGALGEASQRHRAADVFEALLSTARPAGGSLGGRPDTASWWGEVFVQHQLLPFPTLFVDDQLDEDELRLLACRLRYGFSARQDIEPDRWQLSDEAGEVLHYSERSVFVFSIDALAFVAAGVPHDDFWNSTLPQHLEKHYMMALVIVLAQRTALLKMSSEVARDWPMAESERHDAAEERHRTFAAILDELLTFTARLSFVQVFHTEHYHACYQRLRKAFRVDELTREVHDEVSQMSAILQRQAARLEELARNREELRTADREATQKRIERIIFFVTFVILPMQTLLALFGSKLGSWPGLRTVSGPWSEAISVIVIALLLCFPLAFAVQLRRRKRREANEQRFGSGACL